MPEIDSHQPPRERSFNLNIQGARGLFALMIFIFHVHNSKLPAPAFFEKGVGEFFFLTWQFGVELFFCISGFVIAGTLRRAKSPGQFISDRAIRIFPVLWAVMPIVIAMEYAAKFGFIRDVSLPTFVWYLFANLFCLTNIFPIPLFHFAAWSLSYEMAFYTICAIAWATQRRTGRGAWIGGVLGLALLYFHPRSLFFLVGVAVAEGWVDRFCPKSLSRFPVIPMAVCLAAWGGVWRLSDNTLDISMWGWWADWRLPLALLSFVAALPFFQGLADGRGVFGHILRWPLMQWMGKISFSFYLWQFMIMAAAKKAMYAAGLVARADMLSQPLFLLMALPPTLVISALSQWLLEKKVSGFIRRHLHHPDGWLLRDRQRLPDNGIAALNN